MRIWWIKRKAANDKFLNPSLILGKEGKLTTQEVVRNTRLRLMFVLVFVRHQVRLLDLGKRGKIKFQIKE